MTESRDLRRRVRAYVDGVEVDEIPELAEVCAMDDWLKGLIDWAVEHRDRLVVDVIVQVDVPAIDEAEILEVWIGGAPPLRACQIGGVLKSFTCETPAAGGGDPRE